MSQTTFVESANIPGTGLNPSRIALGTWAIGGGGWLFGWGKQDDDASIAAIRHGVELGINWVDTAAIYGLGHSEEVVSQALAGIPASQRPLVFTKCGLTADRGNPFDAPRRDLRPETIRRECEALRAAAAVGLRADRRRQGAGRGAAPAGAMGGRARRSGRDTAAPGLRHPDRGSLVLPHLRSPGRRRGPGSSGRARQPAFRVAGHVENGGAVTTAG